jgi:hypothetical protein
MTILLQNKSTMRFLHGGGGWTPDRTQARIFGTGLEAVFFCLNHHLANMQILAAFTDRRLDFTAPVTDRRGG